MKEETILVIAPTITQTVRHTFSPLSKFWEFTYLETQIETNRQYALTAKCPSIEAETNQKDKVITRALPDKLV
jgi:hypothetical protein